MLEWLQTFCAVAETGSFNKAAELLHMTQPAVTRQMRLLEEKLGAVLFVRHSQGVQLTPAGEAVLPLAKQAVRAVQACFGAAAAVSDQAKATLRLSAGLHVTMYCLTPWLEQFQERYPHVKIVLRPGPHRDAIERLLAYEVDLALIGFEVAVPGIKQVPLVPDPLVFVTSGATERETVSLAELQGRTLLVLSPSSGLRRETEWVLERAGVVCKFLEFPSSETIKTAVRLGMGEAIMPISAARAESKAGTLTIQPIEDWPDANRVIRGVMRAEGALPQAAADFMSMLRQWQA